MENPKPKTGLLVVGGPVPPLAQPQDMDQINQSLSQAFAMYLCGCIFDGRAYVVEMGQRQQVSKLDLVRGTNSEIQQTARVTLVDPHLAEVEEFVFAEALVSPEGQDKITLGEKEFERHPHGWRRVK